MVCTNPIASFFIALSIFLMLAFDGHAASARKPAQAKAPAKPATSPAPTSNAAKPSAPSPAPAVTAAPAHPVAARSIAQKSWGVGIMSWSEMVVVTDKNGNSADARTQMYTPSFHYALRENRATDGLLYEGYAFYGKADIQSESISLIYFQKRVPMYGFGGSVGWYWRPEAKQVNIGVSAPLQMRHVDWTSPPDGGGVDKKDQFNLGLMLDMRWRMTADIAINQRVGTFFGIKGSLWMANLEWTL